jgi:hypothetical protein
MTPEVPNGSMSQLTLFFTAENVDEEVAQGMKLAAAQNRSIIDTFWGDRWMTVVDPDECAPMAGTRRAEPKAQETKKKVVEQVLGETPKSTSGT